MECVSLGKRHFRKPLYESKIIELTQCTDAKCNNFGTSRPPRYNRMATNNIQSHAGLEVLPRTYCFSS